MFINKVRSLDERYNTIYFDIVKLQMTGKSSLHNRQKYSIRGDFSLRKHLIVMSERSFCNICTMFCNYLKLSFLEKKL